jgi:hypothetical protein
MELGRSELAFERGSSSLFFALLDIVLDNPLILAQGPIKI